MKVVAYYRYSTDNKAQVDNSEARQKDSVERVIYSKKWKLVKSVTDEAVSGNDDKPELLKLKNDVENNNLSIDIICIDDLSRITRRAVSKIGLDLDWINDNNILISIATKNNGEPLKVSDLDDDLSLLVNSWQNNQYIKQLSDKTTGGSVTKFLKGEMGWCGKAPLGYSLKNVNQKDVTTTLEPNKDLKYVKEIFKNILTGNSINSCISILEKTHRFKSNPNPKHINTSSIRNILRNSIYAGVRTYGVRGVGKFNTVNSNPKRWVEQNPLIQAAHYIDYKPDGFKPCITMEEFLRVQKILDDNQRKLKKFPERQRHLYSGLCICSVCGSSFVADTHHTKSGKEIRYTCPKSADGSSFCKCTDGPSRKSIRTDELETMIEKQFGIILMDKEFHFDNLSNLVNQIILQQQSGLSVVDEDIAIQKQRLQELTELFITKGSTPSLKEAIDQQQRKIEAIEKDKDSQVEEQSIVAFAKTQYEEMNSNVGFFTYFGQLYEYAIDIASEKSKTKRTSMIKSCSKAVMEMTQDIIRTASDNRYANAKLHTTDLSKLIGIYNEGLTPKDQIALLINMGLDHIKVSFELGIYRGRARQVPTELAFVFSVASSNSTRKGVVLTRNQLLPV